MDTWASPVSILQVNVIGTATYTVETSMDDPNSPTFATPFAAMVWVNCADSNVVNKTASAQGVLVATPIYVRLKQTAGNGSCTMTIAQFGNATY